MNITPSMVSEGITVGYAEMFGNKEIDQFHFQYKDKNYFVDDQYCMNPKCKCNEVILTFFEIQPGLEVQDLYFMIKLDLKHHRLHMVDNGRFPMEEASEIAHDFIANHKETVKLLTNRYQEMKKKGNEILSKRNHPKKETALKIGRNDPCPCGSGKKYKKCCG